MIGRGRSIPDYPLFIFAALLPWKWFISVVNDATGSVIRHDRLIRGIAFPKLVLPIATSTAGTVGFVWGMVPLGLLMLFYSDRLSVQLAWIPVIAAVQYVFTLAAAIFVSAANVFFRDLGNALTHLLRLWWFLSPGLFSLAALRDLDIIHQHRSIGTLASLNPFAVLFEAYRSVIYGTEDGLGRPIRRISSSSDGSSPAASSSWRSWSCSSSASSLTSRRSSDDGDGAARAPARRTMASHANLLRP